MASHGNEYSQLARAHPSIGLYLDGDVDEYTRRFIERLFGGAEIVGASEMDASATSINELVIAAEDPTNAAEITAEGHEEERNNQEQDAHLLNEASIVAGVPIETLRHLNDVDLKLLIVLKVVHDKCDSQPFSTENMARALNTSAQLLKPYLLDLYDKLAVVGLESHLPPLLSIGPNRADTIRTLHKRYLLEPLKVIAADLGMSPVSLGDLAARLRDLGVLGQECSHMIRQR